MSDTLPAVSIGTSWINLYIATGIPSGMALSIENIGALSVEVTISETPPAEPPAGVSVVYPLVTKYIATGNPAIWARVRQQDKAGLLQIGFARDAPSPIPPQPIIQQPGIFLELEPFIQPAGDERYGLIRNNTMTPFAIDQLVLFEALTNGGFEGSSNLTLTAFFEPDLTGTTENPSLGNAYKNDRLGNFTDIKGEAIDIFNLTGFVPANSPKSLRIAAGVVSFEETNQSTNVGMTNVERKYLHPYIIPSGGEIVFGLINVPLIDGGVDTLSSAVFSGVFPADPYTLAP